MNRPSTAKEALIAEALGDMASLINRLEKLAPVMSTVHQELAQSSHALVREVSMFECRMSDISQDAVDLCVKQMRLAQPDRKPWMPWLTHGAAFATALR